jgi:hypothetical protein
MNLTTQQLAELLVGIARTQQAVIDAIESSKAGFKGTYLAPALDSVARIRSSRPLSLQDLPARVLMQCQARAGPNIGQVVRDLEELLTGSVAAAASGPAAARTAAAAAVQPAPAPRAAAGPPPPADDFDLDMTK